MKKGCFGKIAQIEEIEQAGFECAELDLCEIISLPEEQFKEFSRKARESALEFGVFSGLLPLSVRIFEEGFDEARWLAHIRKGAERAAFLGAELIPFGAGKCRSIPENIPDCKKCEYRTKLLEFIRKICDILKEYNICLAIEPLGRKNSNFLNRIGETWEFSKEARRNNCGTMCDLRHMVSGGEDLREIGIYRKDILHAHIDFPVGEKRYFPKRGDGYNYIPYLKSLKQAGYDGRITVEATDYQDFRREAAESSAYIAELLEKI